MIPAHVPRPTWRRRGLAAGLAGAAAVLLASGAAPEADAVCIAAVEFRGTQYLGAAHDPVVAIGPPIGTAVIPACNDTPGSGVVEQDQVVPARGIAGVDPAVAISLGRRRTLFFNPTFMLTMREHPLHPRRAPFDVTQDYAGRCSSPRRATGTIASPGLYGPTVRLDPGQPAIPPLGATRLHVRTDALTRLDLPRRANLPQVRTGLRVRLTLRFCRYDARVPLDAVARAIERLPR